MMRTWLRVRAMIYLKDLEDQWQRLEQGKQGSSSTSVVHTIWIQAQVSSRKVQGCELYHDPNRGGLNDTTLFQF